MSDSIRDELAKVIGDFDAEEPDYDLADVLIKWFPWIAEEPEIEWGVKRMEGMVGTVIPFWKGEAEAFAARSGWPIVNRRVYRTGWEEIA